VIIAHGAPLEIPRELGVSATGEYTHVLERALTSVGEEAEAYVRPKVRRSVLGRKPRD
jgi:hypothetical protein